MAIHFVPPQQDSGLAQALGGLGGLGLGLLGGYTSQQYSIPGKINKFKAFGATDEKAKALANSPEAVQIAWIKETMKEQARQKQALAFSNLVSGGQQPVQQPMTSQPQAPQAGMEALGALGGQAQQAQAPQPGQAPRDIGQMLQGRTIKDLQEYRDKILRSGGDPQLVKDATQLLDREIDTKLKQEGTLSKEKSDAFKVTAPYRKVMAEKQESRSHLSDTLQEMKKLEASGKMTDSTWLQFLDMFGLDFNILKSPETEAYQALEKEFLRDLKSIFGGRISNQEMQTFLRSIPRASNTPEGRKLIRERLESLYKAQSLEYKVMRKIISENNGVPPLDLQERVLDKVQEEKYRKQQEKYSNQFMGIPKGAHLITNEKTGERGYETADGKMYTLEEL